MFTNTFLFASIGIISGSLYFVLGDNRILYSAVVLLFISTITFTTLAHRRKEILTGFVCFMLMFINYNLRAEKLEFMDIASYLQTHQESKFKIISEPKETAFFQDEFIIKVIKENANWKEKLESYFLPVQFLVNAPYHEGFEKNDILSCAHSKDRLQFKELSGFKRRQYKRKKVFFKASKENFVFDSHENNYFDDLRKKIKYYFYENLKEDNAQIVISLLFGSSMGKMPEDFITQIRKLGLGHFFAASGFHVLLLTLLLTWFFNLAKRIFNQLNFNRILENSIKLSFIWTYASLAGFTPSIVRAAACISAYLFLELLYRKPLTLRLLLSLAAVVLAFDPYAIFDISFQFSYLAAMALAVWLPKIKIWLEEKDMPNYLTEIIATTLAVQIFLLPLVIYYFDTLQIWSMLANIILSPFLSLITFCSFLGLTFVLNPCVSFLTWLTKLSEYLPLIDYSLSVNLVTTFLLFALFNLIAFAVFVKNIDDKLHKKENFLLNSGTRYENYYYSLFANFANSKWIRASLISSAMFFVMAINLDPIGVQKIAINKGLPIMKQELIAETNSNYAYFDIGTHKALMLKDFPSIKSLNTLNKNLQEISFLFLPSLKASDMNIDTLVKITKPQFIVLNTRSKSQAVNENIKFAGANAHTIIGSGEIFISKDKYWSI